MAEFRKGYFITAGRLFGQIAARNPEDLPAAYYVNSCTLTMTRDRGHTP
jgi:hypothetical protein